jgi:DNA-binding CsgD family transcriptional regulator
MKISILTPRQQQVLRLMAEGYIRESIAERLGIAPGTVDHHCGRIYEAARENHVVAVLRKFYNFVEKEG